MMNELNKSRIIRLLSLGLTVAGFALASGDYAPVNAQERDPFGKPVWAKPRSASTGSGQPRVGKPKPAAPPPIVVVTAPPIESRIAYYKSQREAAAMSGMELPKVTTVLTLDEMAVTGIFRTPRGYAAMVEAKPIKLSYTVYPGDKFFDGQLVAIEENRLVFRKVTKMSNNKFTASVENKTLRQYTVEQEVQGIAPAQPTSKAEESTQTVMVPKEAQPGTLPPSVIRSPLDEMNAQPVETPVKTGKEMPGKKAKKPVKVAKSQK